MEPLGKTLTAACAIAVVYIWSLLVTTGQMQHCCKVAASSFGNRRSIPMV